MSLSLNKYAVIGGNSIINSKQNKSITITNNSASTAPTSGMFKSSGFDHRVSLQQKLEEDRLPSVLEKTVKVPA
jgi:hypothetical protein